MLILPLHRPLNRATFPFVTAVLILINVAVFALLQSGDTARLMALGAWYEHSGLAQLEQPAYRHYLDQQDEPELGPERFDALDAGAQAEMQFQARLMDVHLLAQLEAAMPEPGPDETPAQAAARQQELQQEFRQRLGHVVTYRYLQRNSELDALRMFTHAFLHADPMHLLGNMFFLLALGLLVEGALGPARFAALYLAGILGSSLFSAAWRWGESGGGLGASGAIAALMGAFCVLWGMRPVRFFWWFFVVFDYVRKPAIWLLPAWVGWEFLNLVFNRGAGVGFDAHLGGLLSGALTGWILVRAGQVRHEFLDAEEGLSSAEEALAQVRALIGRMQLHEASAQLDGLEARLPQRLDVALLRYRIAHLGGQRLATLRAATRVLECEAVDTRDVASQLELLEAVFPGRPAPPGAWRTRLRQRWMSLGCHAEVERLLQTWLADEADAAAWFELALRRRDAGDEAGFRRLLQTLVAQHPQAPETAKARFLLEA